jgi:hypothetical protein
MNRVRLEFALPLRRYGKATPLMPEGLSTSEVGKSIAEHKETIADDEDGEEGGRSWILPVFEAVLLAIVAVLAAWSGFASAKWSTESSLNLAKASAARTEANRVYLDGLETLNFDSTTFNAWFTAYLVGNQNGMTVAERRFRAPFDAAFRAWIATDPFTNPNAPKGPTYMPQYVTPGKARSASLDAKADHLYSLGAQAGDNADNYVRTTVYLATVLFLVGISGHFRVRGARIGLVVVGGSILIFAIILLILAPKPVL